jgi:hypothetical protein
LYKNDYEEGSFDKNKRWGAVVRSFAANFTAHNRPVYASPPMGGSGYEKPQTAHSAFMRLFSAKTSYTAKRYAQLYFELFK